jgi:hypothetical protein
VAYIEAVEAIAAWKADAEHRAAPEASPKELLP